MRVPATPSFRHLGLASYPVWEYFEYGPPFNSLSGLGQTDDENCTTDDEGNTICSAPVSLPTPVVTITTPASPAGASGPAYGYSCVEDANGNCVGPQTPISTTATTPASTNSLTQLLQGAAAAGQIVKSTESPYVIPGTSAIYNPSTGQISGSSLSASTLASLSSSSVSSILPILLIVGGIAIVMSMGRH